MWCSKSFTKSDGERFIIKRIFFPIVVVISFNAHISKTRLIDISNLHRHVKISVNNAVLEKKNNPRPYAVIVTCKGMQLTDTATNLDEA